MKRNQWSRCIALTLLLAMLFCGCNVAADVTTAPSLPTGGNPNDALPPVHEGKHTDADGDEICDECGESVYILLDFYALNDLHGVFCDTATNPGVDELTTYLKNAYADDRAYEILLSSGDMWQGTVESGTNYGALMTKWMNHLGFVSMTMGNHEYDWGSDRIAQNAAMADFPFLGINIVDNNVDTPYCQDSVVVERGGVKIGIIGAIGNCLSSISGEFNQNLQFITGNALTKLVQDEATRLRENGCDIIVYSIHSGSDYDESLSDGYVDLVFEGHTHSKYVKTDAHGVYHLQGGGENKGVSYASIRYNTATDAFEVQTATTIDSSVYGRDDIADDPIVNELYKEYFPDDDPYTTVLGHNAKMRKSGEILRQLAQLYLQKGQELWGAEYDVAVGGGFMSCRDPYQLAAGDVTYSQVASILPFNNAFVLCSTSGANLRRVFLESGNRRYYVAEAEGLKIDDSKTYYVITDTYTSEYGPNKLTEVARFDEEYFARDLLADFISAGGWA